MTVRRLFRLGLLIAVGMILHVVETRIPITGAMPGAKLGLSNGVSLMALVIEGPVGALWVNLVRVLLGSLISGTFLTPTFWFSLTGALLATTAMIGVYREKGPFSLVGVSVMGAIFHNIGQLAVAYLLVSHRGVLLYLPYLLFFAVPTGYFNGVVIHFLLSRKGIRRLLTS